MAIYVCVYVGCVKILYVMARLCTYCTFEDFFLNNVLDIVNW